MAIFPDIWPFKRNKKTESVPKAPPPPNPHGPTIEVPAGALLVQRLPNGAIVPLEIGTQSDIFPAIGSALGARAQTRQLLSQSNLSPSFRGELERDLQQIESHLQISNSARQRAGLLTPHEQNQLRVQNYIQRVGSEIGANATISTNPFKAAFQGFRDGFRSKRNLPNFDI